MIALCVPVYRAHEAPNAATLDAEMEGALAGRPGRLVVALNGLTPAEAGLAGGGAQLVEFPVNRGVAPGWNAAAAAAPDADTLVFGNDDVSLGPGSLAALEQALEAHPEAGIVGVTGSRFDFSTGVVLEHLTTDDVPAGTLVPTDIASGFLFGLRRRDYEAVGGFDEAYAPAIMEEIDLTLAVTLDLGLGCFVVAGVGHTHDPGVSSAKPWTRVAHNGRREFLFAIHRRNRRHFYAKWAGRV